MDVHFFRALSMVRASYWFVPSVMAALAIVLGALMVWLDAGPATGILDGLGWYQKAKPDGAHLVLSTIAGSMITVAGVVFSITIVAIAYAASQYGPRILTNFMSDRGNQVTLGTFIATFVYCLVVLRTIRGGDAESEFVPQLAVMVGLLLALCSIAVLIYFIHHVPNSIHINNVAARIGRHLVDTVESRFPAQVGDPPDEHDEVHDDSPFAQRALLNGAGIATVCCASDGYIEAVDDEQLMDTACSKDLVIKLHYNPGDYLFDGEVLVSVWPADRLDDEAESALRNSYTIGRGRTPYQDILFLVDELVEITARALSTGINDPYTAITCLDWLGAASAQMAVRRIPSAQRVDGEGTVRVIAVPEDFASFIDRGFGRARQYLARDAAATQHALSTLAAVARRCRPSERTQPLATEAENLFALAQQELKGPSLARVKERYEEVASSFIARPEAPAIQEQ